MSEDFFIRIAQIGKTVGLAGKLKINLLTDFPNQFKAGSIFFIDDEEIEVEQFSNNTQTIKFKNVNNSEVAQVFVNKYIYSTIDKTKKDCKLSKDEYFWFDIIGCEIVENGQSLGTVLDIDRFGSANYLDIKTSESLVLKKLSKNFVLPYNDRYIVSTDIAKKIIYTKDAYSILEAS